MAADHPAQVCSALNGCIVQMTGHQALTCVCIRMGAGMSVVAKESAQHLCTSAYHMTVDSDPTVNA